MLTEPRVWSANTSWNDQCHQRHRRRTPAVVR